VTLVVWLLVPAVAFARPKIAVAPIEGDEDGKVTATVAEEASQHAVVIDPKPTQTALEKLGFSDAKSKKAQKKLRGKLGVDVIIYGEVEGKGAKQHLTLYVSGRGKRAGTIELTFKTATSNKFRDELRDELGKQLSGAEGEAAEGDDDDKPFRPYRRGGDDSDTVRHPLTEASVWLDGGAAALHRTLTYETTGAASPPPPVGTISASGELEAEVYPFAMDSLTPPAAGIGLVASVAKTVGLSIAVPGTTTSAPIDESRYTIGARYRFHFGTTTVAAGLSYWRQAFSADQSKLPMGTTLDMPNTEYGAIAPGGALRFAATPKIAIMFSLDIPLVFASGSITTGAQFGQATILAGSGEGAVDFLLGPHYGVRFAALYDRVDFLFQSPRRGVSAAIDSTLALTAMFALVY
jgi:hypothetical protein